MEIILLHGDNEAGIEERLKSIEEKFLGKEIVRVRGKEVTSEFLLNIFRGQSLFEEEKLVVVRSPEADFDVEGLSAEKITLVLCFNKELGVKSKILKSVESRGKVVLLSGPVDKRIFKFLDLVMDKNAKALVMLESLLDEFGFQYILTMLFYSLRRLCLDKMASGFMAEKQARWKSEWSEGSVASFYAALLETDWKLKNGLVDERLEIFNVVASRMQMR